MKIDSMLLELEDYIQNANVVKAVILNELVTAEKITVEDAANYNNNWQVIVVKPSWFKRIIDNTPNNYYYQFVKISADIK